MVEKGFYASLLSKGTLRQEDMEPDIGPYRFYIDSFSELSSCRINSISSGPIPFTAIAEYTKIFDVGDFEDFHYFIRLMDRTYLKLEADKRASEKTPIKKK